MYQRIKRCFKTLVVAALAVLSSVLASFAAMSSADITATTTGISDALTLFYTIGGTILVVLAGIWGFSKITGLLGDSSSGPKKLTLEERYNRRFPDSDNGFL